MTEFTFWLIVAAWYLLQSSLMYYLLRNNAELRAWFWFFLWPLYPVLFAWREVRIRIQRRQTRGKN